MSFDQNFQEDDSFLYLVKLKAFEINRFCLARGYCRPKILDFCSGSGFLTKELSLWADVCGVDLWLESVLESQELFPEIPFLYIEEKKLPFNDSRFDVIIISDALHHFSQEDQCFWLKEILRVLRSDGVLIIFELNPLSNTTRKVFINNQVDRGCSMISLFKLIKLLRIAGELHSVRYIAQVAKICSCSKRSYFRFVGLFSEIQIVVQKPR